MGYISKVLSPGAIVTGIIYDYNKLCGAGLQYGEYVRTHKKTDNTMRSRTVSAITLRPTGNPQGLFYYYSLVPGQRLTRRRCTPIIMPDEVIGRVHYIAEQQKCPAGFTFTRMDGSAFPPWMATGKQYAITLIKTSYTMRPPMTPST